MNRVVFILVFFIGTLVFSVKNAHAQSADTIYTATASPNPFEDEVTINILHGNKNITAIKVFDAIGKEVFHQDLNNHKVAATSVVFNFSHLRPGIYFYTIYSDKGIVETRKLFRAR